MAPPIKTRPSFLVSQSLPPGTFHKPLLLVHQRAHRMKTTSQKTNETDHMDHSSVQFSSVQFSRSVMTDSLQPCESQHTRPPCPSPTPRVYSNSCPSSQWYHPAISSSVVPFSACPQPSQHQGLFQWVNSSHEVAKVLEFQLHHQSFQWTPRTDLL